MSGVGYTRVLPHLVIEDVDGDELRLTPHMRASDEDVEASQHYRLSIDGERHFTVDGIRDLAEELQRFADAATEAAARDAQRKLVRL